MTILTNSVLDLLMIESKRELKTHCKKASITNIDLANFIYAAMADVLPWFHMRKHFQNVPHHLHLTDEDLKALATNGLGELKPRAAKTMNKLHATLEERRMLSCHMFISKSARDWHMLYFDQRDVSTRNNHWSAGSHIHVLSHLLMDGNPFDLWDNIQDGQAHLKNSLHVRFVDLLSELRRPEGKPAFTGVSPSRKA